MVYFVNSGCSIFGLEFLKNLFLRKTFSDEKVGNSYMFKVNTINIAFFEVAALNLKN